MGTPIIIIIAVILLILIFTPALKGKNSSIEKIPDEMITVSMVLGYLEGFKPTVHEERKYGFSEKDVHEELELYLKKRFYSVTREYAIEGKNVKRIDFDLGNGKVGLEIKLAESVLKEGEGDRVIGQMIKYMNRKYNSDNLIIAVAGFAEHTRNTVIHEMREFVETNKAHFIFLKARNQK
jgi:hypothetical protein